MHQVCTYMYNVFVGNSSKNPDLPFSSPLLHRTLERRVKTEVVNINCSWLISTHSYFLWRHHQRKINDVSRRLILIRGISNVGAGHVSFVAKNESEKLRLRRSGAKFKEEEVTCLIGATVTSHASRLRRMRQVRSYQRSLRPESQTYWEKEALHMYKLVKISNAFEA